MVLSPGEQPAAGQVTSSRSVVTAHEHGHRLEEGRVRQVTGIIEIDDDIAGAGNPAGVAQQTVGDVQHGGGADQRQLSARRQGRGRGTEGLDTGLSLGVLLTWGDSGT